MTFPTDVPFLFVLMLAGKDKPATGRPKNKRAPRTLPRSRSALSGDDSPDSGDESVFVPDEAEEESESDSPAEAVVAQRKKAAAPKKAPVKKFSPLQWKAVSTSKHTPAPARTSALKSGAEHYARPVATPVMNLAPLSYSTVPAQQRWENAGSSSPSNKWGRASRSPIGPRIHIVDDVPPEALTPSRKRRKKKTGTPVKARTNAKQERIDSIVGEASGEVKSWSSTFVKQQEQAFSTPVWGRSVSDGAMVLAEEFLVEKHYSPSPADLKYIKHVQSTNLTNLNLFANRTVRLSQRSFHRVLVTTRTGVSYTMYFPLKVEISKAFRCSVGDVNVSHLKSFALRAFYRENTKFSVRVSTIVNRLRFTEDTPLPLDDSCPVGAAIVALHDKVLDRDLALK